MNDCTPFGTEKRLGEVCEIRIGVAPIRESGSSDTGAFSILRGGDIANPSLKFAELQTVTLESNLAEKGKVQEGDVIMPVMSTSPKVVVVTKELSDVVAGNTVIILRPNSAQLSPQYLAAYLRSDRFAQLTRSVSSTLAGVTKLSPVTLRDLPIPVYSASVLEDFSALYSEEQELIRQAGALQDVISSFFDMNNSDSLREKLSESRVSAKVTHLSMEVAGDIDFQIKSFFHFPLAFAYRLIEAEFESTKIQYQLHQVSEGMAAYTAGLLLSLIDTMPKDLSTYVKRALGGHGATFGNWFQIIQRCVPHLNESTSSLHRDMKYVLSRAANDSFLPLLESLLRVRDDFHHRGALAGTEADEGILDIHARLKNALKQLSILTKHPLYLPLDFDRLRGTSMVAVTALRYTGDHPGMKKTLVNLEITPKKNDLYVAIDDGREWRSLYPFISIQYCKHCKFRETFYIDQWKSGDPASLRSFERGHSDESIDVGAALTNLIS